MSRDDDKVFLAVLALLSLPLVVVWRGWALSLMWRWFVAPLGFGPIGIAHAIGLAAIIGLFVTKTTSRDDGREHFRARMIGGLIGSLVGPLFILAIGWVAKGFMS